MTHPTGFGAPSRARRLLLLWWSLGAAPACGGDDETRARDAAVDRPSADAAGAAGGAGGGSSGGAAGTGGTDASGSGGTPGTGGGPPADARAPGDGPSFDQASPGDVAPVACQSCSTWSPAESVGRISAAGLGNLSGMAASWRNPGVVYVHNDRNVPRFYALTETGALAGQFDLQGAAVSDLEDMAVSRCAAGASATCVYLADIGNNISPRTVFPIYRAAEPAVAAVGGAPGAITLPAERFTFSYADGPHNAESLVIDPATATVYVITKEAAGVKSSVYRLTTFDPGRTNIAERVQELPVPAADDQPATAGAAHPCAPAFLLRTGNRLYEFRAAAGAPFAAAFMATPVSVPVGPDPQGEAVTYAADGRATLTTGEGNNVPLHRSLCR